MPNRLQDESSPYLLQHAGNPVDWYPWGEEALARAKAEDRPILLSIGYSACHWCHVMERESFEDPDVAAVMNEGFVSIKVDREERPDLDSIYMRAVQSMTGQGGWPLTAFLTPAGDPFYGGTYYPPVPRHGMPSFRQVLGAALDAFRNRRDQIDAAASDLRQLVERSMQQEDASAGSLTEGGPGAALLDHAQRSTASRFDPVHGGFGGAPKFPQPLTLEASLRHHLRTGEQDALDVVRASLTGMAHGGIHDHLGGGFHRYSVDQHWHVPHFEKMLYDNALLARAYLQGHLATGSRDYLYVCVSTLDYVLDDLRSAEGGFYSARDADSEGVEGKYFVWSASQVLDILGPDDARLFNRAYDVSPAGNWEGTNILRLLDPLVTTADEEGVTVEVLRETLAPMRARLLEVRGRRVAPARDEKVLTGWNGLTIRTLAEAGAALGRADYLQAARRACEFLLEAMRDSDGRLLHSYRDGKARIPGFLEDHGALGNALLSLHESTLEASWLREARALADRMLDLFWEDDEGIFFDTARDGERLVVRPRDLMDNPSPAGNSLAVELLLRLGLIQDDAGFSEVAGRVLRREAGAMARYPMGHGRLLSCLDLYLSSPVELCLLGDPADESTQALLTVAHERLIPNKVVVGWNPSEPPPIESPLLESRTLRGGRPTAFVCRNYACQEPVTTPEQLRQQLS